MTTWLEQNKKPLLQASLLFALLFSAVVAVTLYYDFSQVDTGGLLFLAAFVCCIFIAKNTFDMAQAAQTSAELKKTVAIEQAIVSDDLYIQLYKNSPVPYLILDSTGIVKSANVAAVRMLGISQTEARGIDVFSRLQFSDREHLDLLLEKYRGGVGVSDELVRVVREDEREAWALMSLFGVTNVAGERIGLLTLVDITKQKKAEDAKSEFVSLASHQLRTPIAGMKWSAELLQFDEPERLNERQQKYIDRLLISIRRLAILVDDFLRVSRFELGTFQAEYTEVTMPDFVEGILDEQQVRVEQREITVEKDFDTSVTTMVTDPNLLRMIVTNLFSNAVKYSKQDGVVRVSYQYKEDTFVLTVSDDGIGIPMEDQDAIFSKLFRAANAVRDVPDGTGLGLYIVKQAVSVLKGSVNFTSAEGMGTSFEVVLPVDNVSLDTSRTN